MTTEKHPLSLNSAQLGKNIADCHDIIEALSMTFAEGSAFKALWRRAAARKANLPVDSNEAKVFEFFCQRLVAVPPSCNEPEPAPTATQSPPLAYFPTTGEKIELSIRNYPVTAAAFRETYPYDVWEFNPWTGQRRLECESLDDPCGHELTNAVKGK